MIDERCKVVRIIFSHLQDYEMNGYYDSKNQYIFNMIPMATPPLQSARHKFFGMPPMSNGMTRDL